MTTDSRPTISPLQVITLILSVLIFGAVGIVQFETAQESNIKGAGDALWWAMSTMTTVGYGDKFPVTAEGRLVAVILMVAGVGIFGVFTGYIASLFAVSEAKEEKEMENQILKEIRDLQQQVSNLAARISDSENKTDES